MKRRNQASGIQQRGCHVESNVFSESRVCRLRVYVCAGRTSSCVGLATLCVQALLCTAFSTITKRGKRSVYKSCCVQL